MMTDRRNQLQENYEDALFALIMDEYLREQGKQALNQNERLKKSKEIEISQIIDKRIQKQIQHNFNLHKGKQNRKSMITFVKRVGMVLCAAVILTTTVFAAFPELKVNAMNLWLEITDDYADFRFFGKYDSNYSTWGDTAPDDFVVTWVPEGFEPESTTIMKFSAEYKYTSSDDKCICVSKFVGDGMTLSIDTEDAELKRMQIDGMDALLTKKEIQTGTGQKQNEISLTWWDEKETMIMRIVAVEISESEVIKIAEDIQER